MPAEYINDYDPDAPLPKVGSRWVWEIGSVYARTLVEIDDVRWNGEQWWVYLRKLRSEAPIADRSAQEDTAIHPNEISRFWEAATPVGDRAEALTEHRPPREVRDEGSIS